MALSEIDRLRLMLGENTPDSGVEADTMFSDEQIQDFLDQAGTLGLNKAAVFGWRAKAAEYSNLVDVAEGNSSRSMSDLLKAAMRMVVFYEDLVTMEERVDLEGRRGRVILGKISRVRSN